MQNERLVDGDKDILNLLDPQVALPSTIPAESDILQLPSDILVKYACD